MLTRKATIGLVICGLTLGLLALSPNQTRRAPILGRQYRLVFHALDGLREGDLVTVGGVEAGRVADIDFAPASDWQKLNPPGDERPVVLVTVALRQGFNLAPGTAYRVVSTLRGRHFINILPPPPGSQLAEGSLLNQELDILSDNQLEATIRNFKLLNQRTEDLRKDFANPEFRRELKDLASNMRFYSAEFVTVSKDASHQVARMASEIDRQEQSILAQSQRMNQQTLRVAAYMKNVAPALRGQLQAYRQRLEDGQKQMDNLYAAGQRYSKMLNEYGLLLEHNPIGKLDPEELSQRLHSLNQQLEDYANLAGDVHRLTADPQVQADLKKPLKKVKERSQKLKEQVDGYEKKLDSYEWLIPDSKKEKAP